MKPTFALSHILTFALAAFAAAAPAQTQTASDALAVLRSTPALPVTHWAMPNPSNAGRDAALVDEVARICGGIAVHANPASIEWGLAVQQRTGCQLALLLWHNQGYTFDAAGPPALEEKMRALRDKYPAFRPARVIAHRESGSQPNPVATCPLEVSVEYYAAIKRVWGNVPFAAYATGWTIGYGADARRAEYETLAPFDLISFDLYMASSEHFRKTLQLNAEKYSGAFMPWISLIGAYRDNPRAGDAKPWLAPVQWDRAYVRAPAVDAARGFMLLARSVRDLKLDSLCIYPAFPDLPAEVAPMANALAAYSCGWNQTWPPARLLDLAPDPADFDRDGVVGVADYARFQRSIKADSNAVPTPAPTATPSPTPSPAPDEPPPVNAAGLTPIAAWLSVPGQPAGLVRLFAESAPGVWGVQFAYAGKTTTVRGDGPVYSELVLAGDVAATVIGRDGGRVQLTIRIGSGGPRRISGRTLTPAEADLVGGGAVWLDNCIIEGDGKTRGHPVTGSVTELYLTDCEIRNCWRAQGATQRLVLMSNCVVANTREDVSQNGETLAWVTVTGVHPAAGNAATGEPEHADVAQGWGGSFGPRVFYQVAASDLDYQGFFLRATDAAGIRGLAIVECRITLNAPAWGCGNGIQGRMFHGVIRGNTLTGYGRTASGAGDLWIGSDKAGGGGWQDVRFADNRIDRLSITVPRESFARCEFRNNTIAGKTIDGLP